MRWLELKLPPMALVVITGALMWAASRFAPAARFHFAGREIAAAALMIAGVVVALCGVAAFRRARTTVNPLAPDSASSLVANGIYRHTRNPMYLGVLVALIGWALWLGQAVAFLLLPAFVLYLDRFQIAPEERALRERFGASFEDYCRRVRRWI